MAEIDDKYKKSYVKFKLTNVEVHWAKVHQPDTKYDHKWCLDIHLEDGLAKELKDLGFNVKDRKLKDGSTLKNVFKVTKKVKKADGSDNTPPQVVGPDGKSEWTEPIGNGSICNLNLSAKAWQVQGRWILSAYLDGVQVVTAVDYAGFSDVTAEDGNVPF